MTEILKDQARWAYRMFGSRALELIDLSTKRKDLPEIHQAIVEGIQQGQLSRINEALTETQTKLIQNTPI